MHTERTRRARVRTCKSVWTFACARFLLLTFLAWPHRARPFFIVTYRHLGGDDSADAYIGHAVENFWPPIHRGNLVFQIGDRRVDATTLPALMARFSGDPDFASRFTTAPLRTKTAASGARRYPAPARATSISFLATPHIRKRSA